MRPLRHPLKVRQTAEGCVDVREVGDIVAEVFHRRLVNRRKPNRLDAQIGQILESGFDTSIIKS